MAEQDDPKRDDQQPPEDVPAEAPSSTDEPSPDEAVAAEPPRGEPTSGEPRPGEPRPGEPSPGERPPQSPSLDDIAGQIQAIPIGDFLVSTIMTLTSIAYGKLGVGQLAEARGAIDAIGALMPVLEGRSDPQLKRDFEQALANLRVAFADASARG